MTLGASTVAQVAARSPTRRKGNQHCTKYSSSMPITHSQPLRYGSSSPMVSRVQKRQVYSEYSSIPSTPTTPKTVRIGGIPSRSCDRFIPDRSKLRIDLCQASLMQHERENVKEDTSDEDKHNKQQNTTQTPIRTEFQRRMRGALLNLSDRDVEIASSSGKTQSVDRLPKVRRMLSFTQEDNFNSNTIFDPFQQDQLRILERPLEENSSFYSKSPKKGATAWRKIPTGPSRVLDAPDLEDDYYLNLLSWGKDNRLAVALGRNVYLWNANNGDIHHLVSLEGAAENYVTSVSWAEISGNTHYLAVGTNEGLVQLWDTNDMKLARTMDGHSARVGSLAWSQSLLSSGGRDSIIVQHDVRSRNHHVSTYRGHLQEVCGLKWNEDGSVLASGGNENYLCLWDAAMSNSRSNFRSSIRDGVSPRIMLTEHKAAVKALDFCPFNRHLLASGGGTADRCIKFWNTNSGTMLNSIDTGSQVCSLLWSKHNKEICSSHGFSENQLILWSYPTMTKMQELTGHTSRVLHMAGSPDGATVVSAAADETLRFWDVFGSPPNKRKSDVLCGSPFVQHRMLTIR